ncbi:MAG TPA: pyridoxamine 5'-phosphate oxidase family protein [Acidimicrobiales bacterium]|nr:pyridoxamine 5'-phosphate oxidase family protein [Acidimicrobiales bacterium]
MAEAEKLVLSDEMVSNVNGAFENGKPIVVAYVDDEGQPHLSFRGTTQAFSPDQLAIWIREPTGGILSNIERHPRVTLLYRDSPNRTTYIFSGRARVQGDEETRRVVFDNSPAREQEKDPERLGKALVVDLDTVQGSEGERRFLMKRG